MLRTSRAKAAAARRARAVMLDRRFFMAEEYGI
jgi:hypothetical protein